MTMARRRIAVVEYLRGIAALMVAWFHITNGFAPGWLQMSGAYGWTGVDIFFVISGFVIPLSIATAYREYKLSAYPSFIVRRLIRLEPPYILSILLVVVLDWASFHTPGFAGPPPQFHWPQFLAHFFYIIPFTPWDWMQPVYWTLGFEFVFYLTIGLTFPLLCAPQSKRLAWLAGMALLFAGIVAGIFRFELALFVMGLSLYRYIARMDGALWMLAGVAAAAGVIVGAGQWIAALAGVSAVLIIWALRNRELPGLADRALTWLAAISYSLYLVHVPVGGRVLHLGQRFLHGWDFLLALAAIAVCLMFAPLFSRLVERPAMRLSHRIPLTWKPGRG